MATFLDDFEAQTIGQFPAGWTNRWAASSGTIQASGSGKVLDQMPASDARRVATLDAAGTFADGEVVAKFLPPASFTNSQSCCFVFGRVSGAAGSENAIYAFITYQGGVYKLAISQYLNGASSVLAAGVALGAAIMNSPFWIRLNYNGGSVKAKIWPDGTVEPTAWTNTSTTSATVLAANAAGVGAFSGNSALDVKCDSVGFATTSAETAPMPASTIVRYAPITLQSAAGTARANLSGLRWAWFDGTDPSAFAAPTDKGSNGTTDANGLLKASLPNSTLAVGAVGTLVLTTADGSAAGVYTIAVNSL